jgi:alkylation response protein AidB-like acyl-CoA dehydrogenase
VDFGLSEDQELLQQSAREFLTRECPPSIVRAAAEGNAASDSLDAKIAAMGWPGLLIPETYGGLGLRILDMAIVLAELGRCAAPGPFLFSALLATTALSEAGDRAQKRTWLPRLASGQTIGTLALLEESDRLDAAGVQARARRSGSAYRLTGTKMFVPYATRAELMVTACRTSADAAGVSLFLVDPRAPGVHVRPIETIDRTRQTHVVELRGVEIPKDAMLGGVGAGWKVVERLIDLALVGLAADSFGGAEKVLEMAVEYSKMRQQFGRPIGSFQAIKHIAAEMVAEIEPARSLLWYAAHAQDALRRDASRAASMAKASLSEIYSRSANRAVQIHGGIGFTWEHDIHYWFKRAKWNELAYGDPAHHRERVATASGF